MLVGVRVCFAANPRRVVFEIVATDEVLLDHLSDLLQCVVPIGRALSGSGRRQPLYLRVTDHNHMQQMLPFYVVRPIGE